MCACRLVTSIIFLEGTMTVIKSHADNSFAVKTMHLQRLKALIISYAHTLMI